MIRVLSICLGVLASCPAFGEEEPLVRMVLQEAAHEPFAGMVAVAGVALDRAADSRWPDRPEAVVQQRWQFTGMMLPFRDYPEQVVKRARVAVLYARIGFRPCGGGLFWYHATYIERPTHWRGMRERCRIGLHVFYEDEKRGRGSARRR